MLCKVCYRMLRGGVGQIGTGIDGVTFDHHTSTTTLRRSKEFECSICIALAKEIRKDFDLLEDVPISIEATLKDISNTDTARAFRLDFVLGRKRSRTFILDQSEQDTLHIRTPKSHNTSSDEVFNIAQGWISQCTCADHWKKAAVRWYPQRLIDLQDLKKAEALKELNGLTLLSTSGSSDREKVRLIETSDLVSIQNRENNRYVTLSHCWGKPGSIRRQLKLSSRTEQKMKRDGIELRELTKTFRDAVIFASRLESVGYIWIDSLCIKQPMVDGGKTSEGDWLVQSRVMDRIYRESYLNISATAAIDGDQGLFFARQPESLWEDEITVHYTWANSYSSSRTNVPARDHLTRCTLVDGSLWNELIEQAPVNKRGWVLQERLMSPRVLHFCSNRVAWECREFQDAEGLPAKYCDLYRQFELGDVGRLKKLQREDGLALREHRLRGYEDPDKDMANLYAFELWKLIVETYSKMRLTRTTDKLIALSAIARLWSQEFKCDYYAGLWKDNIASQLLWRVEERFVDGTFENPATRTGAPSFSWAAIDTPYGIIYGETTDYGEDRTEEVFFHIESYVPRLVDPENPFGPVNIAWLGVRARCLKRIKIRVLGPLGRVHHAWRFSDDETSKEHFNLYLDAPEVDADIFGEKAELYCMPAAFGERTVRKSSRYLFCLLLKYEEGYRIFKRIGLAKLPNLEAKRIQLEIKSKEYEPTFWIR